MRILWTLWNMMHMYYDVPCSMWLCDVVSCTNFIHALYQHRSLQMNYTCNLTAKRSINIAWHILGDCLSVLILVFVSKWFLNKWTCIDEGNIYRYLQVLYTWRCIAVIVLFQWIPYILLYIFTNSLPKRLIQIVYIIHTRNKHA